MNQSKRVRTNRARHLEAARRGCLLIFANASDCFKSLAQFLAWAAARYISNATTASSAGPKFTRSAIRRRIQ